jgi:hypothetical protein
MCEIHIDPTNLTIVLKNRKIKEIFEEDLYHVSFSNTYVSFLYSHFFTFYTTHDASLLIVPFITFLPRENTFDKLDRW